MSGGVSVVFSNGNEFKKYWKRLLYSISILSQRSLTLRPSSSTTQSCHRWWMTHTDEVINQFKAIHGSPIPYHRDLHDISREWCDLSIECLVGIAVRSKNKIFTILMTLYKKSPMFEIRNSRNTLAESFWNRNSTQNTRKSVNDLWKEFLSFVLSYSYQHTTNLRTPFFYATIDL